jgi:hypothetical protein
MSNVIMSSVKGLMGRTASKWVLSAAALAGLGMPSAALAHRDEPRVNVDIRIGDRDRCRDEVVERRTQVWVPAQYRTVCDKRWVEPVYQDRCDKVWCEPVYETRCEKVLVPEVVEVRDVRRFDDHCGRYVVVRERVCVRPARYENRETRVCVRDGHFDEVRTRVLVADGHFETVDRQELVCAAHYETRTERVRVEHARSVSPFEVVNPFLR